MAVGTGIPELLEDGFPLLSRQRKECCPTGRWEDYEPGYRYGHELRSRPEYRGRSWTEIEPQLERDWTQRNPSTPWARARESVRDTWENATS